MSYVLEVLDALGMKVYRRERNRVWCLCPHHQAPDSPLSWATTFCVRVAGTRRDKDGRPYDAAGQSFCFACSEGGSLKRLVMKLRDCDAEEAADFIRRRGGPRSGTRVEALTKKVEVVRRPRPGRARFRMPAEVVFDPLPLWVTPAREYAESRGLTAEEVRDFLIGYAVDGRKLGGRIVIPFLDRRRVAGSYSARSFTGEEPKYTTPGAEEHPDPTLLFGEHLWPERARDVVVVTEGALNALAVRRVLPGAVVAGIGGSANFNSQQGIKLATFPRAVLLTDPDPAGDKAADAIAGMIGRYSRVARARLPEGKDALDVGPTRLRQVLDRALRSIS